MKKGWQTKKLSEVCEIIMGQSPDGESYNTTGEGVPLINGPVEFSAESFGKTVRTKFTTQPTKFCKEGDLILCVRGSTTGRMNIAGFDACVGRGVAAIRAKQYQPWINHFISSKRDEIHGKGTGATFPNVSGDSLANFELVVPPLTEQQRIVGLLDEAFEDLATAKANAEKNLRNARALFESHLQSVFTQRGPGWRTKSLMQACQFSNGLWKGEKPPFVNVGVIRNTNFTKEGTLDDSDIAYLDVEVKKLEKRRLQFGDIILEKSGGGPKQPVGRVALFDKNEGEFSFSNFTSALRVLDSDDLDFRFLHKFLYWIYVSGVTQGMQSNSTGIRNLDADAYKAIEITYPPLAEQRQIADNLESLREETQRLARLYERKHAALAALKKSLLHQAFSGGL